MADKQITIPGIDSQPIQVNTGIDTTGISAGQAQGITQPPNRLSGGGLGNGKTAAGTVSLNINGKTYYLLYSDTP